MTRLLFVSFVLLPNLLFSQFDRIDSLKHLLLESSLSESEKGLIAFQVAEQYRNTQFLDSALHYADLGLEMSRDGKEDRRISYYNITGQIHFLSGSYLLANRLFDAGMKIALASDSKKYQAIFSNSLGVSYANSGRYKAALESFYIALELAREDGNPKRILPVRMNIANLQAKLGRSQTALLTLEDIIKESENHKYYRYTVQSLLKKAGILEDGSRFPEALTMLKMAKKISVQRKYLERISCTESMGRIYSKMGKEVLADEVLTNALNSAQEVGKESLIISLYTSLGDAKFKAKKFEVAASHFREAFQRTDESQLDTKMDLHEKLAFTYEKLNKMGLAFKHGITAKELNQKIYDKESAQRMAELDANFVLDETLRRIEELEALGKYNKIKSWTLTLLLVIALGVLTFSVYSTNEKKKSNKILRKLNDEVNEQNREIEFKNNELTEVNSRLQQLTYMASHDLHDPLITIRGFLHALVEEHGEQIPEDALFMIERSIKGSDRMKELIESILMYESVGKNLDNEKIDMDGLIDEILHLMEFRIKDTKAKISIDSQLPTLYGCRSEVFQLFQNIISNALKFNDNDVVPEIIISSKEEESTWIISVQDNGIGMDSKSFEKATEMFTRLNKYNTYPGSGIGLAICQKVVTRHGWQMGVESEGNGSSFWVRVQKKRGTA